MEYSEWATWEKKYPWFWRIPFSGNLGLRAISSATASYEIPFSRPKPVSDSRVWIAFGSTMGWYKRPRVFDVKEIPWESDITLREQIRKSSLRSGQHALYVIVGTIREYTEGDNFTMYERPHDVEDFRSLF
jgi:hypothetical protein